MAYAEKCAACFPSPLGIRQDLIVIHDHHDDEA